MNSHGGEYRGFMEEPIDGREKLKTVVVRRNPVLKYVSIRQGIRLSRGRGVCAVSSGLSSWRISQFEHLRFANVRRGPSRGRTEPRLDPVHPLNH